MTSDAQHHPQVAEVRQPDARTRLIYTRHAAILPNAADSMQHEDPKHGAQTPGKAWSGRFAEPVDRLTQRYTASVSFDRRLAEFDIQGSLAHARMLSRCGHPRPRRTSRRSSAAWRRSLAEIREGRFDWSVEREDVHLNIEHRLTELVGDAGKRLHTARSRNDQVATDIRLWLRAQIDALVGLLQARAQAARSTSPRRMPRR